jgi:hypothetical protein
VCVIVKTIRNIAVVLLVFSVVFSAVAAPIKGTSSAESKSTPGLEAAKAISLITGVAISPLLGVGTVGAWEYFSAPPETRARLPWYAQPMFWIPALMIVAMAGAKDIFGTSLPVVFKKPFDVAETIENKISALVVAGAFVPLIAKIFPQFVEHEAMFNSATLGFAAIDPATLFNVLLVPIAIAVFFIVWLAAHAINILILMSPFSTVDAALKLSRLAVLGLLTALSFLSPYLGAIFAVLVIIVSYFVSGWAFRLMVVGNIYVWDFLTLAHRRFQPRAHANWMFTGQKLGNIPIRTYGKLARRDDQLVFEYRPWLFLPRREFALPQGNYVVGRGLFYPEIRRTEQGRDKTMLILPPRFRSHEEAVAALYQFPGVRDVGLLKGFKAIWGWSKNLVGFGAKNGVEQAVAA